MTVWVDPCPSRGQLGRQACAEGCPLGRPPSDGNYGTFAALSAWVFNRAFVSMSYLSIAMF
jgi:hypothetical protein